MAIETEITVELVSVDVTDDYRVAFEAYDVDTHTTARVTLTSGMLEQFVLELAQAQVDADRMRVEDRPVHAVHGFDRDLPVHPECRTGKCSNCDGRTMNDRDEMVPCAHDCHRMRGAA